MDCGVAGERVKGVAEEEEVRRGGRVIAMCGEEIRVCD